MTKNITLLIILLALLLAGCSKTYTDSVAATEISLEENQEIIYGQIETITGNDMTLALALAAEPESAPKAEAETNSSSSNAPMTQTSARSMTSSQSSGNNTQMPPGTGEAEGQTPPGDMDGQTPEATDSESQKSGKSQMTSRITYTLTGEKKELRIPVGTTVTTSLGTTTTFSRLASGDMLKLVLETSNDGTETITSIWIVG